MRIRPMTAADLDAVQHLAAATPEAPQWSRAAYERFLPESNPSQRIFLAEIQEVLAGFAAGKIAADICELESIAVRPSFRRSGVGSSLLSSLMDWARQRSASRVELEVRASNNSAISLYTHLGFRQDGLRRHYYHHPAEDAVLMGRTLHP